MAKEIPPLRIIPVLRCGRQRLALEFMPQEHGRYRFLFQKRTFFRFLWKEDISWFASELSNWLTENIPTDEVESLVLASYHSLV